MKIKLIRNFALVFLALAFASGCANVEEMSSIRATAEKALAEAKSAYARANSAHHIASEAAYEAKQASGGVASALECCNDNAQRLDRMFEKAMAK